MISFKSLNLASAPLSLLIVFSASFSLKATAQDNSEHFFEERIRPVLIEHCYECHSANSKLIQGGLLLDSREGTRQGGDSGAAVVPGQVDDSLLLKALRFETFEMPPKGKLSQQVIADFETWIRQGAPDPRESNTPSITKSEIDWEEAREFWSFRPREAPLVSDHSSLQPSAQSSIDGFIDESLLVQGLSRAATADKASLLRRMSFDLLGLPPTLDQLRRFTEDDSFDVLERMVDELLANPAYGERWGRYWLDLARYANSNGADENHAYPVSWRYRDYVVNAFNGDTPFDQMVTEQLAGDLLPYQSEAERRKNLTATGFLVMGPKMLAEQDKPKLVADYVDEQLDTVGQTFLGLTLGCARCHDHKFDPIRAEDYYAMAGIFHSTKSMEHLNFVSQWNERALPDSALQFERDAKFEEVQSAQDDVSLLLNTFGIAEKDLDEDQKKTLQAARDRVAELEKQIPAEPKAMACDEASVREVPVHVRGSHLHLVGAPLARSTPKIFESVAPEIDFPSHQSGRLELARWLTDPRHPLTARVIVNRIWQGHFGEGIVRTSSNFGIKGELPSHPELLDYLATELVTHGWSIKHMHRRIMLSAVYQQRWVRNTEAESLDPENRLLWRQNRRRLELEPLRDSLILLGDNLDRTLGGELLPIYGDKLEKTKLARTLHDSPRRTIYLPINRAAIHELFSTFDYVDSGVSVGKRSSTTVPHQALFLLNSPFVLEQSMLLAQRVADESVTARERLDLLFQLALGRVAWDEEWEQTEQFLRQQNPGMVVQHRAPDDPELWVQVCRALIATNEFILVE